MLLGCHLSVAGGLHNALEKARQFGFETTALFVRNQRQWRVPPLSAASVAQFRKVRHETGVSPIVAHGSYLLNLAGSEIIRRKSIEALAADLDRCEKLGIEYLVIHPGCHSDKSKGIALIAGGINEAFAQPPLRRAAVKLLLETTAGSGSVLASRFEEIAEILAGLAEPQRVGVCLDTCHVFAAGYDIRTAATYGRTMKAFDDAVGIDKLLAVHLNDSLKDLGSRVDRHAHIGQGKLGLRGFRHIVNDSRLANVPMILETPKAIREEDGKDWDEINGQAIRSLVRK